MKKALNRDASMKLSGAILLIFAVAFIILYIFTTTPQIQQWYAKYEEMLYKIDLAIISIGYKNLILLVIFLLYIIRSFVPIISISAIFVLTGMVFPSVSAFVINFAGFFIMLAIKYWVGYKYGGGSVKRFLYRYEIPRALVEHNGKGNPWLLFIFRLFPFFPINSVSQLYGSLKFKFKRYALISILGYAPKMLSYTFIGQNVFDPLSFKFFLPVILLLCVSGASIIGLNAILNYIEKTNS